MRGRQGSMSDARLAKAHGKARLDHMTIIYDGGK